MSLNEQKIFIMNFKIHYLSILFALPILFGANKRTDEVIFKIDGWNVGEKTNKHGVDEASALFVFLAMGKAWTQPLNVKSTSPQTNRPD